MSARAMHRRAIEIRSPEVISMSYSRRLVAATCAARRIRSSVVLPMALTTTTTWLPFAPGPGHVVGHGPDPLGVADRRPAELLDEERHDGPGGLFAAAGPPAAS